MIPSEISYDDALARQEVNTKLPDNNENLIKPVSVRDVFFKSLDTWRDNFLLALEYMEESVLDVANMSGSAIAANQSSLLLLADFQNLVANGYRPRGNYDIATNTPDIVAISKTGGDAWFIAADGTSSITGTSINMKKGDAVIWNSANSVFVWKPNALTVADGSVTPAKTSFVTIDPNGNFIIQDGNKNVGLLITKEAVMKAKEIQTELLSVNGDPITFDDFLTLSAVATQILGVMGISLDGGKTIMTYGDPDNMLTIKDGNDEVGFNVTKDSEVQAKGARVQNLIVNNITAKNLTVTDSSSIVGVNDIKYTNSAYKGKTIWWAGTSIPAGGQYPEGSAAQHGATAINKAIGSSSIRKAKTDGSINGVAWQTITRALSHTIAEKQDLIDNWDTYKLILTNSPPSSLTDADKTFILSCSYENSLLPYLNGTFTMPSLFILDHGVNDESFDIGNPSNFVTIPSTRNNRNYFLGACNYIIDLILQYNPRARIAIMGHHENTLRPAVPQAQQVLANYWSFPFCKLWEQTGWSNQLAPGSVALWSVPPYNAYTSTGQDMSVFRIWNPDNLHPHTDTTGKSQALLTNLVGAFINRVY